MWLNYLKERVLCDIILLVFMRITVALLLLPGDYRDSVYVTVRVYACTVLLI